MNTWKDIDEDPKPSNFDYPETNFKSNQFKHIKSDYYFYKVLFILIVIVLTLIQVIVFLKFIFTRNLFNIAKKTNIKYFNKFSLKNLFIFTVLLVILLVVIGFYRYKISKHYGPKYFMELIGYGFQNNIETPSVFNKSNLKEKYFPEHKKFTENFSVIKKEVKGVLKYVDNIPLTHNAIPFNEYISRDYDKNTGKGWKTFPIKLEGKLTGIGKLHCPEISKLVNIPIIRNATLSILEGKRHIPIHCGYFKGYIRYLFCVIEPKTDHAFIYINKKKYIFKENQGILWDDIFPHEVYNMSNDYRVCLYLDVLRKLDNPIYNWILKKLVSFSRFSSTVKKINAAYEKKPESLDDIPKYNNA